MLTPVFIAILLMTNGINRAFPIDDENDTDFPIHELFGVPATTPGLNVYQCHPPSLYNGYSGSKEERCYCECAADCMMYGTCCVDFLWDKKQPLPLKEYFVKFLKERNKYNNEKKLTCQPMIPMQSTKNKHIATSYHMIASCPSNATNLTIVEKCTKLTVSTLYSMIPVLGSDGHAYRNNYCAQCNGENNFNQHIDIEVKCVDAENIKGKTNIDLVDIGNIEECVFEPSNKFIRKMKKCTKQEEEQCSPENDNYKLCHAYQGVLSSGNIQNYHCLKCQRNDTANRDFNILNELRVGCPETYCEKDECFLPSEGKEYSKYINTFTISVQPTKQNVDIQRYKEKFPIRKFLDISNDYVFPMGTEVDQYLCNYHHEVKKCCKCHPDCMKTKECCIDAFWDETNHPPYLEYLHDFISRSRSTPTCEYVYPLFEASRQSSESRLMVKSCPKHAHAETAQNCLNSTNVPFPVANVPVISVDGVLYANLFCARCNEVSNYTFAILKLECDDVDLDENDNNINTTELAKKITTEAVGCVYTFPPQNNFTAELCIKRKQPKQRDCSHLHRNYELCNSYLGKIDGYANYHCLKCHLEENPWQPSIGYCRPFTSCPKLCTRHATTPTTTEKATATARPTNYPTNTTPPPFTTNYPATETAPPFPFTTLPPFTTNYPATVTPVTPRRKRSMSLTLDFSKGITYNLIITDGNKQKITLCDKGKTYDQSFSKCVEYCTSCVTKDGNNAPETFIINIENATFEKCLLARGVKLYVILQNTTDNIILHNNTENATQRRSDIFTTNFQKKFPSLNATFKRIIANNSRLYARNKNNTLDNKTTAISTILELNEPMTFELLRNFSKELHAVGSSLLYKATAEQVTVDYFITSPVSPSLLAPTLYEFPARNFPNKSCHLYEQMNRINLTFTTKCGVNYDNETISPENLSMWIDFKQARKGIARCKQFHLTKPCLRTFIRENITLDNNNDNITVHLTHNKTVTYSPEEYLPINDGYYVCISPSKISYKLVPRNPALVILSDIEDRLSLIGTCISIVCYVWIIASYLILKDLRNLPGYSYTFMCVCLLLSDCMFIASVEMDVNTDECTSFAVLMHWSLMCTFMWTMVIAFDLVAKFKSFSRRSHDDCMKQVKRRCLLTFSVPTVYITTLIALDQTSTVSIQYGIHSCWISNFHARLGFYIIPVALITISTLLAIIYTIVKIRKEQKVNERVLQTNRRSNLLGIALKLTIILGVSELIGYIQIGVSNPSKEEEISNAAFKFAYSVTRSLRGVMLWFVLILGADMVKKYRKRFIKTIKKAPSKHFKGNQTVSSTLQTESEEVRESSQL